eukprot:COSAG03_NODE_7750_length_877_cov_0.994859_1_plen_264_part_10
MSPVIRSSVAFLTRITKEFSGAESGRAKIEGGGRRARAPRGRNRVRAGRAGESAPSTYLDSEHERAPATDPGTGFPGPAAVKMGWTYLAAALCGCACVDGSPRPLELKAADGSASDLTWLASLEDPAVVGELQALADRDLAALDSEGATAESFVANFGPNSDLTLHPGDWTALVLQNKGRLDPAGCAAAPLTCAALSHLAHHLTPHRGEEVGVRLLKLGVNATIRPHVGPGGRLVAHLGVRVPPTGAFLTVAGERVAWREGELA